MKSAVLGLLGCLPFLGCASATGGTQACTVQGFFFSASPAGAGGMPDHTAAPPGNQEQFEAGLGSTYGPGCVSNALAHPVPAAWTSSDPANVSISSAADATNGLATCLGASASTVSATLTVDGLTETRSAAIVCH